ncbi:6-bladed beta-propeller, partial [Parabacteroides distasonis]|nr:6-bladed beta-propeller [Parabacteroides distasonis]
MKWIITISAILLFALAGCGKDKQSTNELITVDVTKNYPEKELTLQDFMDVEYIPL